MKIVIHGKLAQIVGGSEFEIATDRVSDAIEGLSRQIPQWPREMLIDVVGFETEDKLRARTDVQEIHLVPALYGGGGGVGKIILGAALIAAAFLLPPVGLVAGLTLNALLFSVGLALVMSGVMQLFFKAPTVDKSDDPPPSKYLGNNSNTTAAGTYRINAWGRNRIAGHWLSIQVDAVAIVRGRFPATTS